MFSKEYILYPVVAQKVLLEFYNLIFFEEVFIQSSNLIRKLLIISENETKIDKNIYRI